MWRVPKDFDGESFRDRYGLSKFDFTVRDGILTLEPGVTIPDNPPIMDAVDPAKREKKKRAKAAEKLDDADGKIVMDMLEAMYAELRKNKPRTFAELKAEVVGRFVG